jgi:hypothetical protein
MRVNDIYTFFRYDGRQYRRFKKLKAFSPWSVSFEMRSCAEEALDLAKDTVFLIWVSLCYLIHHIIASLLEICSLHSILRQITLRMA